MKINNRAEQRTRGAGDGRDAPGAHDESQLRDALANAPPNIKDGFCNCWPNVKALLTCSNHVKSAIIKWPINGLLWLGSMSTSCSSKAQGRWLRAA